MILSPTLVILHLSFQSSSLFFSTLLWSPQILVHMVTSLVGSLVAQMVKNLLAMQETWVRSLGWEDPQRREWLSTPVFLPGESHGQRSLASYSQWGHKESDTTEWLTDTLVGLVGGAPVLRLPLWWTTFLSGTCFHSCGSWWVSEIAPIFGPSDPRASSVSHSCWSLGAYWALNPTYTDANSPLLPFLSFHESASCFLMGCWQSIRRGPLWHLYCSPAANGLLPADTNLGAKFSPTPASVQPTRMVLTFFNHWKKKKRKTKVWDMWKS